MENFIFCAVTREGYVAHLHPKIALRFSPRIFTKVHQDKKYTLMVCHKLFQMIYVYFQTKNKLLKKLAKLKNNSTNQLYLSMILSGQSFKL